MKFLITFVIEILSLALRTGVVLQVHPENRKLLCDFPAREAIHLCRVKRDKMKGAEQWLKIKFQ